MVPAAPRTFELETPTLQSICNSALTPSMVLTIASGGSAGASLQNGGATRVVEEDGEVMSLAAASRDPGEGGAAPVITIRAAADGAVSFGFDAAASANPVDGSAAPVTTGGVMPHRKGD